MAKKSKFGLKQILVGSGLAAVAGYLAGILTAPKSGKQTRGDIVNNSKRAVKKAEREAKKVQAEADDAVKQLKKQGAKASKLSKDDFNDLTDKAKTAGTKAKAVATAFKDGKADDEELNRAVNQAKSAVKNVRKYLQK
jgi:gas vesicle protein